MANIEDADGGRPLYAPLRNNPLDELIKQGQVGGRMGVASWPNPGIAIGPSAPVVSLPPVMIKAAITTEEAFNKIKSEILSDSGYGWSWHCSVALAASELGISNAQANKIAELFMHRHFGVPMRWAVAPIDKPEPGREAQ